MNVREIVDQNLEKGYDVEFDKTFEKTWQTFKQNMGNIIGFTIVCCISSLFVFGLFLGPLLILGFSTYSYEYKKSGHAQFSDFFKPLNKFGSLLFLSILFFAVNILVSLPTLLNTIPIYITYIQSFGDKDALNEMLKSLDEVSSFSSFYSTIVQFLISVLTFYAPYLVYYGDYGVMEAILTSFKLVSKKIGILITILFIATLIKFSGIILCCIGVVFTFPFIYCLYHEIFDQTILSKSNKSSYLSL